MAFTKMNLRRCLDSESSTVYLFEMGTFNTKNVICTRTLDQQVFKVNQDYAALVKIHYRL